ncbi:hypothetical protein RFI_05256 [Reticulomyxa filosa]|uniref:Endonuclease/exonuclease/phosphatase domain-containing protein n=1 Tax=Reticulomyxa filosa TaxID=46433 RepID=X6P2T9_RETFI|nr:hypothetical protein RFI_05256 [Reticulomyxa filosa]|eukprot:ETO31862.1 hypothetical protein RFI_05256 [Reticulomyxa filosa]
MANSLCTDKIYTQPKICFKKIATNSILFVFVVPKHLLKGLDSHSVPVIICGDMNSGKGEVVDQMLLEGKLSKDYRDKRWPDVTLSAKEQKSDYLHEYLFRDSYEQLPLDLQLSYPNITFAAGGGISVVDFLYYTYNNCQLIGVQNTLPEFMQYNIQELLLPNENWVSDHLPIAAVYQFIPVKNGLRQAQTKAKEKTKTKKKEYLENPQNKAKISAKKN